MAGNKKNKRKSAGVCKTVKSKTPILFRYTESQATFLKNRPYLRLDQLYTGKGTEEAWADVYFRLNIGVQLAIKHFNSGDADKVLLDALNAHVEIRNRYFRMNKKWGIKEEEMNQIKEAFGLIDQIQDGTSRREQLVVYKYIEGIMRKDPLMKTK